jgi:hypothetical protein
MHLLLYMSMESYLYCIKYHTVQSNYEYFNYLNKSVALDMHDGRAIMLKARFWVGD